MNTVQVPPVSEEKLSVKFARQLVSLNAETAGIREDVGFVLKEAKKAGIHTMALKLALRLRDMESAKRDEFLTHFDKYRDDLELDSQLSLDLSPEPPKTRAKAPAEAKVKNGKGGNVTTLDPKGRKGKPKTNGTAVEPAPAQEHEAALA